jgi:hypothetical protein
MSGASASPTAARSTRTSCLDAAARLAYVAVLDDETAATAIGFMRRLLAFYEAREIDVERQMTESVLAYTSLAHTLDLRVLGVRLLRSRPGVTSAVCHVRGWGRAPVSPAKRGRSKHPYGREGEECA